MNEEYYPEQDLRSSLFREIYDWVEAGMVAVVCVVLMFTFVARMAGVDGISMNPTLFHGERLIVTRLGSGLKYGDIVVVTKPNVQDQPLIKRVIAVGGQTVEIDFGEGIVYVDGMPLDEPYTNEPTHLFYDIDFSFPVIVPEGNVFVMGDNRNYSWDSRSSRIGMIDERYIMGRVIYRVAPYDRMGVV